MTNEALPLVRGYEYRLRMAVTGGDNPVFPEGSKVRAQVREYAGAPRLLAELTFDNGGLRRVSNDSVDMVMSEAATRAIGNSSAVVEFSRTDVTPYAYLYIMLRIPVMKDQISAPVVVTVKPALAVALSTPPAFYGGLAGMLQGGGTAVATLSALASSMLSGAALGGGSSTGILRSIVSAGLNGAASGVGSGIATLRSIMNVALAGTAAGLGTGTAILMVAPLKILLVGSSTPARYFTDFSGPQNDAVTASTNGTTFAALGTTGAGACYLGDILNKALGRPIQFIKKAVSGTRLSGWEAGDANFVSAVNAAKAAGGVDLVISIVGFNDVDVDQSVVSQASHLAKLRSFAAKLRTELGQPNVPIFIGGSQNLNDVSTTEQQQIVWVRGAELQAAEDANNRFYAHAYDLQQAADGIHQANAAAYATHTSRGAAQILALLQSTPQARGPRVVSAASIDATTTDVTIAHTAGSDFTPTTGLSGWAVSIDDFATRLAVSAAVRVNATTVRLTHASTGGPAPKVAFGRSGVIASTGALRDNSALTLPIDPVVSDTPASGGGAATKPATMAAPALTAGNGQLSVDRADGTSSGGSAITGYDLRYGTDGATWTTVAMTTDPQVITGLTNGSSYQVQTRANNAIGNGDWSPSATATPTAAAPAAPQDTFTDANGTSLASHTGEGGTWTVSAGGFTISGGAIFPTAAASQALFSASPPAADYGVEFDAIFRTVPTSDVHRTYGILRAVDAANNYLAGYNWSVGNWYIGRAVSGGYTLLMSGTMAANPLPAPAAGETRRFKFTAEGNVLKLYCDGVLLGSVTDTTFTAAGKTGVRSSNASGASATVGINVDNFKVVGL